MIHDVIGIGFGPGNIAVAIALEELFPDISALFLETRDAPSWQPNMILNGSDIQHNPIRDLVTLRNPQSHYSFVNYLHKSGRLIDFLNIPLSYPLRKEYARYVVWAAKHFDEQVRYSSRVTEISFGNARELPESYTIKTASGEIYHARSLILSTGRTAFIPPVFKDFIGNNLCHLNEYISTVEKHAQRTPKKIVVVGGSQSAVEIILDLRDRFPHSEIKGFHRGFGYRMKDASPFIGEIYYPETTTYFYKLSETSKEQLRRDVWTSNYSASDRDVLEKLYVAIYEDRLDGIERVKCCPHREIVEVQKNEHGYCVHSVDRLTAASHCDDADLIILATGFINLGSAAWGEDVPPLLAGLHNKFAYSTNGKMRVNEDYSVGMKAEEELAGPIYLNGLCEQTHGLGDAGSFSLLSIRAERITRALAQNLGANLASEA